MSYDIAAAAAKSAASQYSLLKYNETINKIEVHIIYGTGN